MLTNLNQLNRALCTPAQIQVKEHSENNFVAWHPLVKNIAASGENADEAKDNLIFELSELKLEIILNQ